MDYERVTQDCIERMKVARPTCDRCDVISYSLGDDAVEDYRRAGWEDLPHRAGLVARCPECQSGKLFPWADKLDVKRVAHMLEHDARCQSAFELKILEETLE
jgi:hypothetical protein